MGQACQLEVASSPEGLAGACGNGRMSLASGPVCGRGQSNSIVSWNNSCVQSTVHYNRWKPLLEVYGVVE